MANLYTDFDLFITFDGIYLRINCTDKNICNMEMIDKYLLSSGIRVYDKTAVQDNLKKFESATFKIANAVVDVVHEHIHVTLSEDEMIAYIEFMPPSSNGRAITAEDVKVQLQEAGILGGIYFNQIDDIVQDRSYFVRYEIAKGMEPIEGTPAFISYHFDTSATNERKPRENADGTVDYHKMDIINPVREGDLLATVEPAIPGIDGETVTGKSVPPRTKLNNDLIIRSGKNVKLSEDKKQAYAGKDGQVLIKDSRVVVQDVYFVSGDVDTKSGNIAFNGDVMISGTVRAGFKVEATGDVQVNGTVEGAYIHTAGSVLIKGGIQGMSKASIYAGKDIRSKFIENAEVISGGNIETGSILYSDVIARNALELKDKKGFVIGGVLTVGREVMCKNVGSEMGSMTIIQVGRNGSVNIRIAEIKNEIDEIERQRKELLKVIKHYKGKIADGESLTKEEKYKLKEMVTEQGRMQKDLEIKSEKIKILEEIMLQEEFNKTDRIIVTNDLGNNVKLCVNSAVTITRDEFRSVKIIKHKGELRIGYYEPEEDEEE